MRFRTTSGLDLAVDPIQMKNVTFEHVKGVEEAKNELQDVVEFLKNPQKFTVLGGKLPKGGDLFLTLPVFNREFSSLFFVSYFSDFFQESSWWVHQEQGRPYWHGLWQARPTCRSTTPPGQSSMRCLWVLVQAASGTFSVSLQDVRGQSRLWQNGTNVAFFNTCRRGKG